jgi:hypothetical protein
MEYVAEKKIKLATYLEVSIKELKSFFKKGHKQYSAYKEKS